MRSVTEPLTIAVGTDVSITISPPPAALDAAACSCWRSSARSFRPCCRAMAPRPPRNSASSAASASHLEERRATSAPSARPSGLKESLAAEIAAAAGRHRRDRRRGSGASCPRAALRFWRLRIRRQRAGSSPKAAMRCAPSALPVDAQISAHQDALTRLAATRGTLGGPDRGDPCAARRGSCRSCPTTGARR